jgi:tetratricopeptide (TPR) repeat protein
MKMRIFILFIGILASCNQKHQNYLEQARKFAINKDPLAMIVVCNAGLQEKNYSDSLFFYRAMGLGVIKKYDKALQDWMQFVAKNPNCDTCILAIAKTQLQLGDTSNAEKTLKSHAFIDNRFRAQSLIEQAMIAFYQEKWTVSLNLLNEACKVIPEYFLPYYYKGFYYSQFAGADETQPMEFKIYPCLNFDSAMHYFNTAIDLNTNFADSYYRKGLVFENTFRNDSALKYYETALKIDSVSSYLTQRNSLLKKLAKP